MFQKNRDLRVPAEVSSLASAYKVPWPKWYFRKPMWTAYLVKHLLFDHVIPAQLWYFEVDEERTFSTFRSRIRIIVRRRSPRRFSVVIRLPDGPDERMYIFTTAELGICPTNNNPG